MQVLGISFRFSWNVYLILNMIIINFPLGNLWIFRIKSVLNQCSLVTSIFERWGKFCDENEAQPLAGGLTAGGVLPYHIMSVSRHLSIIGPGIFSEALETSIKQQGIKTSSTCYCQLSAWVDILIYNCHCIYHIPIVLFWISLSSFHKLHG